jgi:hypothetical protein
MFSIYKNASVRDDYSVTSCPDYGAQFTISGNSLVVGGSTGSYGLCIEETQAGVGDLPHIYGWNITVQ